MASRTKPNLPLLYLLHRISISVCEEVHTSDENFAGELLRGVLFLISITEGELAAEESAADESFERFNLGPA